MIIDASALSSILRNEPEARSCAGAVASTSRRVSAVNYVEAAVVIDGRRNPVASRRFDDLFREARLVVEPVTEAQARIAREAYRDFGKGSGHPAGLNFGDCFAYALAKATGEPLLFKGDDFTHGSLARSHARLPCARVSARSAYASHTTHPLGDQAFQTKALLLGPSINLDRLKHRCPLLTMSTEPLRHKPS
jgi:ribonuclease VapC